MEEKNSKVVNTPTSNSETNKKETTEKKSIYHYSKDFSLNSIFVFISEHPLDFILYFIALIALVFYSIETFYCGLTLGIISGIYFKNEILSFFYHLKNEVTNFSIFKILIFGCSCLAIIMKNFYFIVGIMVVVFINTILQGKMKINNK